MPCVAQVQLSTLPMASSIARSDAAKNVKTTVPMDNVVTTLLQHKDHFMLTSLMPGLSKLNWNSNVGHVLDVALTALGLSRSKAGKELWTAGYDGRPSCAAAKGLQVAAP